MSMIDKIRARLGLAKRKSFKVEPIWIGCLDCGRPFLDADIHVSKSQLAIGHCSRCGATSIVGPGYVVNGHIYPKH